MGFGAFLCASLKEHNHCASDDDLGPSGYLVVTTPASNSILLAGMGTPQESKKPQAAERTWDHTEWGSRSVITVAKTPAGLLSIDEAVALHGNGVELAPPPSVHHADLDQFRATAIAGNDLLSSCLYTAGLCALFAGPLAPVALLLVSFSA